MTKLIFIIIFLVLLGCSSIKEIHTDLSKEKKEEVQIQKEIIIQRDTTFIYVPGHETQSSRGDTTSSLETTLAMSFASYRNGCLYHKLTNKDSVIIRVPNAIKQYWNNVTIIDSTFLDINDISIRTVEKYRFANRFFYTSGFIGWSILILYLLCKKIL